MPEAPATRPSLLVRLRDLQDHEAWSQFVGVYAPIIYGYARKRGLQDADAADVTQSCLRRVAVHVGSLEYDQRVGTFRGWLFTIVRNQLRDYAEHSQRRCQGSGDSEVWEILNACPAQETEVDDAWECEYRRSLLAWAAEQVRAQVQPTTWQAFWQTAVEGKAGKEVAAGLGLSTAAVYLAKSRVMSRLRELIREVQDSPEERL
jgi:RNA polymerase sigma-70 factor (ECF subfamily)